MKKKLHEDIIFSIVVYVFLIFMAITGTKIRFPESRTYPYILLGIMFGLNTVLLINTIRFSRSATAEEVEEAQSIKWKTSRYPLMIWLVLVGYVALYDFTNFYVATAVMTEAMLYLLKIRNWKWYVFLPIGLLLGVYLLFVVVLKVRIS